MLTKIAQTIKKNISGNSSNIEERPIPLKPASLSALSLANNPFVHIACLTILIIMVYSNTLNAPFQWDESVHLVDNPLVKNLRYFAHPSEGQSAEQYKFVMRRYIAFLTFALNYKIHGFSVVGYHIVNIAIHIANTVLVYLLVLLTFRTPFFKPSRFTIHHSPSLIAFFSAILFAVHPLQTEAVTYVMERFASLAAFFYLLSIAAYIKARQKAVNSEEVNGESKTKKYSVGIFAWYFLSVLSAVCAMKTKENAFTLPIVIMLYEFCFFSRPHHPSLPLKGGGLSKAFTIHLSRFTFLIPLLLTLFIIPLTHMSQGGYPQFDPDTYGHIYSRSTYLYTEFRVIVTYLRLLFFPVNQNLVYDYPVFKSFFAPQVMLSFLFLTALFGLGVYMVKQPKGQVKVQTESALAVSHPQPLPEPAFRLIGFGILWFFITISVESSVIPLWMLIFEYRVYLPSAGFFIALCTALCMLLGRFRVEREKRMMFQLAGLIIIVLSGLTYVRNSVWTDKIVLWKDVAAKNPRSELAYNNLGVAYLYIKQPDKAIEMFDRAVSLSPLFVLPYHNMGEAFSQKKEYDKALEAFTRANAIHKNYATYTGISRVYIEKGEYSLALTNLFKALALNPHYEPALYYVALCYSNTGKYKEARQVYDKILHDDPYNSDVYRNRGEMHMGHKEYSKAISDFASAVRIDQKDIVSLYKCAVAYHYSGLYDFAIREYGRAISLNDKNPVFYDGRGLSFYYKKDYARSIEDFTKAIELNPKYPQTYSSRGLAYSEIREFDRAITDFNKALSLDPNLATVYTNRGNSYLKTGEKAKAGRDFKRGCALKDADACASLGNLNGHRISQ